MNLLKNIRIRNKIILIIVIVGAVSSFTGNLLNYFYELNKKRGELVEDSQMHARLISEYCSLPLEFNYPENAQEVLMKLSEITSVIDGILYNSNDSIFAEYHRNLEGKIQIPSNLKSQKYFLQGNYLHVLQEVQSKKGIEGYIYLRSEIDWKSIMLRQGLLAVSLTLIMVLIIFALSYYFQRGITDPIISLTDQMKQISGSSDYKPAVGYVGKDEIGQLYHDFNLMIERIETREREKKAALESLKTSEAQYQNLYENAPVMYISTEIESAKILQCNKTLCQLTGYTKEELIGRNILEIYHPDCHEMVKKLYDRLKTEGKLANQEIQIIKKDGTILDISLDSTIGGNEVGEILNIQSVWRDISIQKQAQNAEKIALDETKRLLILADKSRNALLSVVEDQKIAKEAVVKLNETLEHRVKERTAQLENANKELETFTYSVSHDLKAPLRGIDGYSKLLLDIFGKKMDQEAQSFISTIRSSTLQMNQLIDDLLDYSRLERSQLTKEKINLQSLINTIASIYKNDLDEGKCDLKINIPEVELFADEKGLTIALRNLIENAIKFTKARPHPAIEIGLAEQPTSWIIHVKDNGIGFDMKYHQRIFEIFQRLHRAEDFKGTGIGLAMVNKAMQRMHGRVWAESILGKGSTFYLEIHKLHPYENE